MEMADGLERKYGFRKDVQSDLPWQLDEGIRSDFPKFDLKTNEMETEISRPLLSSYPIFSDAVLRVIHFDALCEMMVVLNRPRSTINLVQFVRRLSFTTSSAAGLSYLDTDFKRQITVSPNFNRIHLRLDVFAALREQWITNPEVSRGHGPRTGYPSRAVHSLTVLLIIDLMITPNNDRSKDVPDIQHAYLPIVRDLVSKSSSVLFLAHET